MYIHAYDNCLYLPPPPQDCYDIYLNLEQLYSDACCTNCYRPSILDRHNSQKWRCTLSFLFGHVMNDRVQPQRAWCAPSLLPLFL